MTKFFIPLIMWVLFFGAGCGGAGGGDGDDDDDNETSTNWSTQTADDSGWVGIDPSIAVDSSGYPHITHYDQGNRDLRYARWDGSSWQNETVDSTGDVGEESGIAIDSNGDPHVSYIDATNGPLKYAKKTGGSWSIETVDPIGGGNGAVSTSIALDANDYPRIVYNFDSLGEDGNGNNNALAQVDDDEDFVKYASWDGSSWTLETVTTNGTDVYLALDSSGDPHVCFTKEVSGNVERIHYATKTSGSWSVEVVDSSTEAEGDCGIAADSNNRPHITYNDYGDGAIKYASWDGSSWNIQTVDTGVGREEGLKMDVDSQDNPHIIYSDAVAEKLIHVTLSGGSWTEEIISNMGNPAVVIDSSNRIHVAHSYTVDDNGGSVDDETEILKYSIRQ